MTLVTKINSTLLLSHFVSGKLIALMEIEALFENILNLPAKILPICHIINDMNRKHSRDNDKILRT